MNEAKSSQSPVLNTTSTATSQYREDTIEVINPSVDHLRDAPSQSRSSPLPRTYHQSPADQTANDPRSQPTQTPKTNPSRLTRALIRLCDYFKTKYRKHIRPSKRSSNLDDNEDFVRSIRLGLIDPSGVEQLFHAQALFDTGNPHNLISPAFAAKFGLNFDQRNGRPILETPGRGEFVSIGQIPGRFAAVNRRNSRFLFDPKFYDAVFEVSHDFDERFDVIIGCETITQERLLNWRSKFACTGFRSKPAKFDEEQAKALEAEKQKERAENSAQKKAWQDRATTPKNP